MMAPRMAGLRRYHSLSASLVTVTKSLPKNTAATPSTSNRRSASGDLPSAFSGPGKSAVPDSLPVRPGRNLREVGRAQGRERRCQDVEIAVVGGSLNKKTNKNHN